MGNFEQFYQHIKKNYEDGKFAQAAEIGELTARTIPIPQDQKILFYEAMGMSYLRAGNWQMGWRYIHQAMDNTSEYMDKKLRMYSNFLVFLHFLPDLPDEEMFFMHREYGKLFMHIEPYIHDRERHKAHKKIKIGYLSPDFYEHIVTNFAIQLYSAYDRECFEVHLYNTGGTHNTVTEWLAGLTDGWHDLHGRNAADIAAQIYADEIDILVDLAGHTKGGLTLRAMAYKPAPVQLSGIGYFSTTGLPAIDYYITDGYCDPPGNERFFTEKLLRLPHSHFCYTPPEAVLHCKAKWQLHDPIVFGSFSNFFKLNDDILLIWRKILQQVPGSRLLLKNVRPTQKELDNLQEKMMALGFDMDRVELRLATHDYLDEYADIDIALDPYPYPGGGTTCEAIYMGVPVVSLYGIRHGSRFGYSLLKNIGLDELVVPTPEKYVETAMALAASPELLQGLHENLRKMMQSSPVMDAKHYLEDMQAVYEKIYKEWLVKG